MLAILQNMTNKPKRDVPYEMVLPEGFDASGMDVSGDDIRKTDYSETILRGAKFRYCDARQQDFTHCDLRGADFSGAWLLGATFAHAIIDESTIFDKAIYDENTTWATPENIAPAGALRASARIKTVIASGQVTPQLLFESRMISSGSVA